MKKILLIDDRTERQLKFSKESGFCFEDYSDVMDNVTAKDYDEFVKSLNPDFSLEYDVIITHRSAFGGVDFNVLDRFKSICKNKKKKLIFFSGGISSSFFLSRPFQFLLINSKTIYGDNLTLFLEDSRKNDPNLLILGFGDKWKINVMLSVLEKINFFVGSNQDKELIQYAQFRANTQIQLLDNIVFFKEPELVNGRLERQQLHKLANSIANTIKQQVVFHA